jgi:ubiquinone/menaquinone biosynthesis C-methylase UbiE
MITDYNCRGREYDAQQRLHVSWDADTSVRFLENAVNECTGRILDAGCGTGRLLERLLSKGKDAYGIDLSQQMKELAAPEIQSRITVGSMGETGYPDTFFNAIVSRFALHYLQDFSLAYREFHRILKPGGILAIVAEHPLCDYKLNNEYQSGLTTSFDLFGVMLQFPSHTFNDYLSEEFFRYFSLDGFDEGQESGQNIAVPAYIALKARRNAS